VNFPTLKNSYKNKIDLIDKILQIYSIAQDKPLRNFERAVMRYYILHDYCQEAKEAIKEDEKKKEGDIRVADRYLRQKGYLITSKNNMRMSDLSSDMNSIRESFIKNKKNIYVLLFAKT
jgi:hypothetical protein